MNLFAEALSPSEMSYSFEALAADVKKAEEMTEVLRLLSIVNKKISIISDMNEIDECVLPLFEDVLNQKIAMLIKYLDLNKELKDEVFKYQIICFEKLKRRSSLKIDHNNKEDFNMLRDIRTIVSKHDSSEMFIKVDVWNEANVLSLAYLKFFCDHYNNEFLSIVENRNWICNGCHILPYLSSILSKAVLDYICPSDDGGISKMYFQEANFLQEIFCIGMKMFNRRWCNEKSVSLLNIPLVIHKVCRRIQNTVVKMIDLTDTIDMAEQKIKLDDKRSSCLRFLKDTPNVFLLELSPEDFKTVSEILNINESTYEDVVTHENVPFSERAGVKAFEAILPKCVIMLSSLSKELVKQSCDDSLTISNVLLQSINQYCSKTHKGYVKVINLFQEESKSLLPIFIPFLKQNNMYLVQQSLDLINGIIAEKPKLIEKFVSLKLVEYIRNKLHIISNLDISTLVISQNHLITRLHDMNELKTNIILKNHAEMFTKFWNECFSSDGQKLNSVISRQWLLLGFDDHDPSQTIKTILPLYLMTYLVATKKTLFLGVTEKRLLRGKYDYNLIKVSILHSNQLLKLIDPAKTSVYPIIFNSFMAIEELFCTIFFSFDSVWTHMECRESQENIDTCYVPVSKIISDAWETETTLEDFNERVSHDLGVAMLKKKDSLFKRERNSDLFSLDSYSSIIENRINRAKSTKNKI